MTRIALAVKRVAHKRMIDMTHVHANLMRAPGIQMAFNKRVAIVSALRLKAFEHLKRGNGLACKRVIGYGHLHAVARGASDTGVDGSRIKRNVSVAQGDIATVKRARANKILKDTEPALTGDDIREGLTAIISIKIEEPQFEGQTKQKLGNSEARGAVDSVVSEQLTYFLEQNPTVAKNICEKSLLAQRAPPVLIPGWQNS